MGKPTHENWKLGRGIYPAISRTVNHWRAGINPSSQRLISLSWSFQRILVGSRHVLAAERRKLLHTR